MPVERRVSIMRRCVDLARIIRDRKGVGLKYPLRRLVVISADAETLESINQMADFIREEVGRCNGLFCSIDNRQRNSRL